MHWFGIYVETVVGEGFFSNRLRPFQKIAKKSAQPVGTKLLRDMQRFAYEVKHFGDAKTVLEMI